MLSLFFLLLAGCNTGKGVSEGGRIMSEGVAVIGQGGVKVVEGIVTIARGTVPILDGVYKDTKTLTKMAFQKTPFGN